MKFTSPQTMINAACAEYFDGRMPSNYEEWVTVFNYIAFNIAYETEEHVMPILALIYKESGITPIEAREIGIYQMQKKEEEKGAAIKAAQRKPKRKRKE